MKNKWKVVSIDHFTEASLEAELHTLEVLGYTIHSIKMNFDKYYPKAFIFARMK